MTARRVFPVINFSCFSTGKYSQTDRAHDPSFSALLCHSQPRHLAPSSGPPSARLRPRRCLGRLDFRQRFVFPSVERGVSPLSASRPLPRARQSRQIYSLVIPPAGVASPRLRCRLELLRTRGRVPFYPINTVNFPDPFLHFFPPISSLLPPIPISPGSALG